MDVGVRTSNVRYFCHRVIIRCFDGLHGDRAGDRDRNDDLRDDDHGGGWNLKELTWSLFEWEIMFVSFCNYECSDGLPETQCSNAPSRLYR